MNKQLFIEYLHDKSADLGIKELDEICSIYPFFQTAQLLYAKKLYDENDILFNQQLSLAAIYAQDRKQLYRLIHERKKEEKNEELFSQKKDTKISKSPFKIQLQIGSVISDHNNSDSSVIPILRKEDDFLEREIMKEVINSSILLESSKEIEEIPEEKEIKQKAAKKARKKPTSPANSEESTNNRTFGEWLQLLNGTVEEVAEAEDYFEAEKSENDLISDFIKSNRITIKPRSDFYDPIDKAKESVQESNSFLTPTWAKVLEGQGKYVEAIEVYQKLSLNNPEKSTYFAGLIEELKNKLKK